MNLVDITELPRMHGFPVGRYLLRYSTLNTAVPGAVFKNGETVEPVSGRVLQRLRGAYGATCQIEPWDGETAMLVADYLESVDKPERAAQVRKLADPEHLRKLDAEAADRQQQEDDEAEERAIARDEEREAARVQAEADEKATAEKARQESDALSEVNAAAAEVGKVQAEAEGKAADEAAQAEAAALADEHSKRAAVAKAALEAQGDGNPAASIEAVVPVIDDDVDTIDDLDILRAMAAGEGVDPGEMDVPTLQAEIRKARAGA